MRKDVLGTEFDDITLDDAVTESIELIASGGRGYTVTPNPEIIMASRNNPALADAVNDAFLVLPDGIGVVIGSKILGRPLMGKVAGIEYGETLLSRCAKEGYTAFFLGAKPGVAEKAAENLMAKYPGLNVVGTNDGYFKDSAPIIEKINSLSPDVLFVCLGFPTQELWMAENVKKLNIHLALGLGGSLDIFAGVSQRAPDFFVKHGLEWFYRLIKEPWRAKRQLKLPEFLILVVLRRLSGGGR